MNLFLSIDIDFYHLKKHIEHTLLVFYLVSERFSLVHVLSYLYAWWWSGPDPQRIQALQVIAEHDALFGWVEEPISARNTVAECID